MSHFSSNSETILLGDFNVNWDVKKDRKALKQITDHHHFTQLIEQPTRLTNHSRTRIDLLFTTCPDRIPKNYNLLTGLSDHNAILFTRKLTKQRHRLFSKPTNSTPLYNFIPRNQQQNLAAALHNYNWADVLSCDNVTSACHLFNGSVKEVMGHFTSRGRHKKKRKHSLPWVNEDCRRLMCKRDEALRQSLKTGLTTDRIKFTSLRNKVTQSLRKSKADFFLKIIANANGNGKLVWQTINKLTGQHLK